MKYLILFLISFSASANFIKIADIGKDSGLTVWTSMKRCGANCIKIPKSYNAETHKKEEILIPDTENPIVSKSEIESCVAIEDDPATTETDETKTIEEDCQEKLEAKVCTDPEEYPVKVLDTGSEEVYCTKTTYPMVGSGKFHVVEDIALKDAYEAAESAKKAQSDAINAVLKRQKCGAQVKAAMVAGSSSKGLTEAQIDEIFDDNSHLLTAFDTGSSTIEAKMSAVVVDGVKITQADKDSLIAMFEACK